jgi:hypothetical protein
MMPTDSLPLDDFAAFSATFADLDDPEVMKGAWACEWRRGESNP